MTDKEYKRLAAELEKRGYRKWDNDRNPATMKNCNWSYSKSFVDDEDDELRYQINWLVYDRNPYADRDPWVKKSPWGVEVTIYVAHAVEMHLWNRPYTIEEVEDVAAEFFKKISERKLNTEL